MALWKLPEGVCSIGIAGLEFVGKDGVVDVTDDLNFGASLLSMGLTKLAEPEPEPEPEPKKGSKK